VDDFLVVDIEESLDDVVEVVLEFEFADAFALLHHFVEGVVAAEFEYHVDVLAVLEDVIEQHYVFVLQRFMDFDFSY
jgi:hypothetical protein